MVVKVNKEMEKVLENIEEKMGVKFNEEQRKVIFHKGKPLNVLSCAGSGKTTTLIAKMLFMEMYYEISPVKILSITFNADAIRKGAAEFYSLEKAVDLYDTIYREIIKD